jgi:hypothetical protein
MLSLVLGRLDNGMMPFWQLEGVADLGDGVLRKDRNKAPHPVVIFPFLIAVVLALCAGLEDRELPVDLQTAEALDRLHD